MTVTAAGMAAVIHDSDSDSDSDNDSDGDRGGDRQRQQRRASTIDVGGEERAAGLFGGSSGNLGSR